MTINQSDLHSRLRQIPRAGQPDHARSYLGMNDRAAQMTFGYALMIPKVRKSAIHVLVDSRVHCQKLSAGIRQCAPSTVTIKQRLSDMSFDTA